MKVKAKMNSFTVPLWYRIFYGLQLISVFGLLNLLIKPIRGSYLFVDIWVHGNFILSILVFLLWCSASVAWVTGVVLAYAALRLYEILIYQFNVIFFGKLRAKKKGQDNALLDPVRSVLSLLLNYIEVIFWFALFYLHFSSSFRGGATKLASHSQAFGFSLSRMTFSGIVEIVPNDCMGYILLHSHATIGLFMTVFVVGWAISVLFED